MCNFLKLNLYFLWAVCGLILITPNISLAQVQAQTILGDPIPGLTDKQLRQFRRGKRAMEKDFRFDPITGQLVEEVGLGPVFNSTNCASCHNFGALGGAGTNVGVVTRFGRIDSGVFDPLPELGGSLLQVQSLFDSNCNDFEQVPAEANVVTNRNSPQLFGLGLIEQVSDADLLSHENKPVTGGVAHMVPLLEDATATYRVGRFGWKSQLASVLSFSGDAAANEIGITNDLLPLDIQPNAPDGPGPCTDDKPGIDDVAGAHGIRYIDELTDFMRFLSGPPQTPRSGMSGEATFSQIGCTSCHTPSQTTRPNYLMPALSEKTFKPYSDFLLHDMGQAGDGIVQGDAGGNMIRTTPLWGLSRRFLFLHDASISSTGEPVQVEAINQIVAIHELSPEAQGSASNYNGLTAEEKYKVAAFIFSLGRREFDHTGNGDLTAEDFQGFRDCFEDPQQNFDADHECAISDVNQDGYVDLTDAEAFASVYPSKIKDCQCDGVADLLQILDGSSQDLNNDLSPDECQMEMTLTTYNMPSSFSPPHIHLAVAADGLARVSLDVSQLAANETVEFFYSYDGEGNGNSYGDAYCINLNNENSLGVTNSNSEGQASISNAFIDVPPESEYLYVQAGILNSVNGNTTLKSQVVKLEVLCHGDVDCDQILDEFDNCPYNANTNQNDDDGDGIGNICDNCVALANASQLDGDLDGYGNICDGDFNNDNIVNFADLGDLKQVFFSTQGDSNYVEAMDLNGNGGINFDDLGLFKGLFFTAPGPSGLECAGEYPCQ